MLNLKKLWTQWRSRPAYRVTQRGRRQRGMTLIELLIASLLLSVVILIAWSGLISLMNMSAVSEAKGMRAIEVNRALDFLSAEIRTATRVNATANGQLDASTSLTNLLQNEGFDLNRLGNYGDLVLYMEIPAAAEPPATCPAGGPNAGLPPPTPSDYDQVIYDVRNSPAAWLNPKITMRYGRIKDDNGVFNPCENPVSSDPIADALTDDATNVPACSGILTGGPGFYACQDQDKTNLFLQNELVDESVQQTSIVATPRRQTIQTKEVLDVGCHNEANLYPINTDTPYRITFDNQTGQSIFIHHIEYDGTSKFYGGWVLPNNTVTYDTYLTHPWVAALPDGTCQAVYLPEADQVVDSLVTVVMTPKT